MTKLTKKELQFIQKALNYETREEQHSDNFSNAGTAEAAALFNGSRREGKKLIRSLERKGIGAFSDAADGRGEDYCDVFWLRDDVLDDIYDLLETGILELDIKNDPTKKLVEFYNKVTGKSIKKFSDRATAEARCQAEYDALLDPKEYKPAKMTADLSEIIAETWKNEETRAKRRQRSAVVAGGVEYPSVRAAFVAKGLPISEHIGFRMRLKAEGKTYRYGMHWEIIPLNY